MAVYRVVSQSFWTDPKVDDDFTPEDKFFYLYLLTNPHTNICGCYEISEKQCCRETGYNLDTITRLLKRFEEVHDVIRYNPKAKEVLILNWYKYNWTSSEKLDKAVKNVAQHIKTESFRNYIYDLLDSSGDTVSIPYPYPMDTSVSVSVSNTVSVSKSDRNNSILDSTEIEERFGYNDFLLEAVKDWLAYKKERRESYRPTGLKNLLSTIQNNVTKYGEEAVIDLIRESMGANYQGITWNRLKQPRAQKQGNRAPSFYELWREETANDKRPNAKNP